MHSDWILPGMGMGMGPIFDDWNGNGNGNLTIPTTAEIILYLQIFQGFFALYLFKTRLSFQHKKFFEIFVSQSAP